MGSGYKRYDDNDIGDEFVLPEGSVLRGQLLFKKHCAQCHSIRRDGANPYGSLLGPNLYGVMGRTAAQNLRTGWSAYSRSLEASGILWTDRNMMAFLKNPRGFAGGVINMNFRGIDSFKDRVDLVHYLKRAGHESWMVQDGTPHSQKMWWTRGSGQETTQYWSVHATDKQLKPWQRLRNVVVERVGSAWNEVSQRLGFEVKAGGDRGGSASGGDAPAAGSEEDVDLRTWREVAKVENGVRAASLQQSFNWPPPEVVAAGPVKKPPTRAVSSSAATARAPSAEQQHAAWVSHAVACQHPPQPPPLQSSERAPSGLMVYREPSGGAQLPSPPPHLPRAVVEPLRERGAGPGSAGVPAPSSTRVDGGRVTPSGLVLYTE